MCIRDREHVIRLSNRIDNVVNDLSNDVENNSTEIRESVMTSLKAIMASVGERLQPATRTTVEQVGFRERDDR